jgi:hypothetical protein
VYDSVYGVYGFLYGLYGLRKSLYGFILGLCTVLYGFMSTMYGFIFASLYGVRVYVCGFAEQNSHTSAPLSLVPTLSSVCSLVLVIGSSLFRFLCPHIIDLIALVV